MAAEIKQILMRGLALRFYTYISFELFLLFKYMKVHAPNTTALGV